jgi:RES domain-containing protein
MVIYRMHGPAYDAFDSTGSFLHAGRWHKVGTRVIYGAEHVSLAVLETMIHAGGRKIPPRSLTRIDIPDGLAIEETGWRNMPCSQDWGDAWARELRTAILRVPSVAVNGLESNYLLNPAHPEFPQIRHDPAEKFTFSPRFFMAG